MKILLIRNDNLGDLINTTPAIEALRKKYRNATIDIVVNSYNFLGIRKNPFIDNIFVYTKPKHKKSFFEKITALNSKIKVFYKIFKKKYDIAIVFRSSFSPSATQFAKISNAKLKIGVGEYFDKNIEFQGEHEVMFCINCLKPLDVKYNNEKTFFYIDEDLKEKFSYVKDKTLFHISSRVKENQISKEKFKEIFNSLQDLDIIFTAEPKDLDNALWLKKHTNAKFIKTDNLKELAAIIKNVKLFISLDGGALHIGPAVDTKTIALFGKTDINRWYPWGYKDLVLQDKSKIAENINNKLIIEKIKEQL